MSTQSVYELARNGANLSTVLAALQRDDEFVTELACANRFDLLEELKDHSVYGERARQELNIKQSLDDGHKKWEDKVAQYPPLLKEWREILVRSPKLGYFDVSYPSVQAIHAGLGNKYVAICGDGLFLFMFEVISLEKDGEFRLTPHPTSAPSQDCLAFQTVGRCDFGSVLTGPQITNILQRIYG